MATELDEIAASMATVAEHGNGPTTRSPQPKHGTPHRQTSCTTAST